MRRLFSPPWRMKLRPTAASARSEVRVPHAAAPFIDASRLEALRSVLSPEAVAELVSDFVRHLEETVARSREASDESEIGHIAHAIAGTAGNLGAMQLSQLASGLD